MYCRFTTWLKPECNLSNFHQIIHRKRGEHERRTLRGKKLPLFSRAPSSSSLLCRSLNISGSGLKHCDCKKHRKRQSVHIVLQLRVWKQNIVRKRVWWRKQEFSNHLIFSENASRGKRGRYKRVNLAPPHFFSQFLLPSHFFSKFLPPPYFFSQFLPPPYFMHLPPQERA